MEDASLFDAFDAFQYFRISSDFTNEYIFLSENIELCFWIKINRSLIDERMNEWIVFIEIYSHSRKYVKQKSTSKAKWIWKNL